MGKINASPSLKKEQIDQPNQENAFAPKRVEGLTDMQFDPEAALARTKEALKSPSWKDIEARREQNKDNPNYPSIFWVDQDDDQVQVTIGDKKEILSSKEALERYGEDANFKAEYDYLMTPSNSKGGFIKDKDNPFDLEDSAH